jgi:hypothetical protein
MDPETFAKLSYSRGFDRGNYGNAYESTDWDSWYAEQCAEIPTDSDGTPLDRDAYQAGMLLGFFASYELDEIADDMVAEQVAALRAKYGDD